MRTDEQGSGRKHHTCGVRKHSAAPCHMPRRVGSVFPLRVAPTALLVTMPELLNLSVGRLPRDSPPGTAHLTGVPRIGWDRL